jgi:hypothetical protein
MIGGASYVNSANAYVNTLEHGRAPRATRRVCESQDLLAGVIARA